MPDHVGGERRARTYRGVLVAASMLVAKTATLVKEAIEVFPLCNHVWYCPSDQGMLHPLTLHLRGRKLYTNQSNSMESLF